MIHLEKVLYTARTHTTGGRGGGASRTSDGRLDIKLSLPPAACFLSAIKIAAHRMKVTLPDDVAIDAEVDLGPDHGDYGLAARLNVSLPGIEREVAQRLADTAHELCPYSRATHGNIEVATNIL